MESESLFLGSESENLFLVNESENHVLEKESESLGLWETVSENLYLWGMVSENLCPLEMESESLCLSETVSGRRRYKTMACRKIDLNVFNKTSFLSFLSFFLCHFSSVTTFSSLLEVQLLCDISNENKTAYFTLTRVLLLL